MTSAPDVIARGFYALLKGADVFIKAFEILSEEIKIFIKGVNTFNRGPDILSEAFDIFNKGVYLIAKGVERIGKAKSLATSHTKSSTSRFLAQSPSSAKKAGRTCLFTTHGAANSKRKAKKCPLLKN